MAVAARLTRFLQPTRRHRFGSREHTAAERERRLEQLRVIAFRRHIIQEALT